MKISVIIPVYNEEEVIRESISSVDPAHHPNIEEVIVVDGGSTDQTIDIARETPAKVISSPKGRAVQMNCGASEARGDILYFLHADSIPPEGFDQKIKEEFEQGNKAGCFQLTFDHDHVVLNFYAWCTRFDIDLFRFGDQSLFIKKDLFQEVGGFCENLIIMEDNEIIKRIKSVGSFSILPDQVTTSSRKYLRNGIIKLQLIFTLIVVLYKLGVSQQKLGSLYKKLVH